MTAGKGPARLEDEAMSLGKTLLKVAIGVAVAKGVSTLVKGGTAQAEPRRSPQTDGLGDLVDSLTGGGSARRQEPAPDSGGLGDLMDQISGKAPSRRTNAPRGGLEDMLGGGQTGGGLGDLLGQLAGGGQGTGRSAPAGGSLGDLLGQLTGASGAARGATQGGGGLGDLLGQLTGGAPGGAAGGGLGDLLGAVLGGGAAGPVHGKREQDLAAALILRAMVAAAKSDGKFDKAERARLTEQLDGASQAEIAYVNAELDRELSAEGLAAQVPQGMEAQVYLMSLMAIDLDNRAEADHLHRLASALGLDPDQVNALHDKAGAPRLYR